MPAIIKPKQSATAGATPSAGALATGELAANTNDGLMFIKHTDGSVRKIGSSSDRILHTRANGTLTNLQNEVRNSLGLNDSDFRVVAGVMRQNAADRTKWDYITTTYHEATGVSGVSAVAIDPFNIQITLARTFSNVIYFSAHPDEWMASRKNITVGSSVGLDTVEIQLGGSIEIYSELTFNATSKTWTAAGSNPLYNDGSITTSWDDTQKLLTINHSYCPELNISVESIYPASCFSYRRGATATSTTVGFVDGAWNPVTPGNGQKICFRKVYNGPIQVDGSANSGTLKLELGNIWFFGFFRV